MTKWLPLVLLAGGGFFWITATAANGQNPEPPAAQAKPAAGQTIKQIETIDDENARKVEALRKSIDQEVLAKHITEVQAQNLRFGLRVISTSAISDSLINSLTTANLKPENAALATAIKSFEAEWSAAQAERPALIKKACAELRTTVTNTVRSAKTVEEVDQVLADINRLENVVPVRNTPSTASLGVNMLSSYGNVLRNLRKVIAQQASSPPDPVALAGALSQLLGMNIPTQGAVEESTLQQRVQDTLAPFQKAQDEAQEKVETFLLAGKPYAEVNAAVTKLEETMEANPQLPSIPRKRDPSGAVQLYRTLASILSQMEAGQFAVVRRSVNNMRSNSFQALGPGKTAAFTKLLGDWDKKVEESMAKVAAARRDEIRTRLAAVKRPPDLEVISAEVAKNLAEPRDREPDFPRNMPAQLNALAAAWATSNPNLLRQAGSDDGDTRFSTELMELRHRVEREVMAGSLRAPELLQPPLAEKPLEEAIETLKGQLAGKGEWRRLLQLLDDRTGQARTNMFPPTQDDLAAALRAFIAGQNMELAEQWRDALLSYKTVLRCTSDHAPIKEAAERVKALTKEHPDAVPAATSVPSASLHVSPVVAP